MIYIIIIIIFYYFSIIIRYIIIFFIILIFFIRSSSSRVYLIYNCIIYIIITILNKCCQPIASLSPRQLVLLSDIMMFLTLYMSDYKINAL